MKMWEKLQQRRLKRGKNRKYRIGGKSQKVKTIRAGHGRVERVTFPKSIIRKTDFWRGYTQQTLSGRKRVSGGWRAWLQRKTGV